MKTVGVVPTKNESEGIAQVVREVAPHVDEVLVIDGHSSDGTADLAARQGARVILDNGKGKGAALRMAAENTDADVMVFIDADGSHSPADIPLLIAPILAGKADLVLGSRIRGGSDEMFGRFRNFVRASGGAFITLLINLRWATELTDVENGFRAVRRDTFLSLGLRAQDFDIEQEMVMKALKKRFDVTEVASHESVRKWGQSKLPTFKKAYIFFWRLFVDIW